MLTMVVIGTAVSQRCSNKNDTRSSDTLPPNPETRTRAKPDADLLKPYTPYVLPT